MCGEEHPTLDVVEVLGGAGNVEPEEPGDDAQDERLGTVEPGEDEGSGHAEVPLR